ncbi:serine hydroxymethyltransferase [Candidatus Aciduliprofundum boonei]|uniref:Glycine hydroxymethyltransferase n=1 Tax=Aciduliprofundum boonei (strain DSM 19572 / T469) TaxID=439481 RepID=B5I9S5_ACIB4|nr:serine hydroxymethyltransferase [Candidatus Aciduliprofundum boonei]ADD08446.1 Glycine hydroxymethyltransferase [Aciduliprofundum boonei T469]EDY37114.1 serine hydroxymethyltransferase [Aciduliprofundum boonei T469]HII55489.1 serine hydroxymethyltransferase [Candidatus Aciduliprofundum boonei]
MNPQGIIQLHDEYRKRVLNMQASENFLSYRVRKALASDMASRYSMLFDKEVHGSFVHNAYGGTKYQEEIKEYAENKAREIFGFKFANVKPISGHIAAMTVLLSLTNKGDKIMAIPPELGGYDGYSQPYMPDMFDLNFVPLDMEDMRRIDVEKIRREKPKLIILGASYILFPYNLTEVLEVAEEIGARVVYDASHIMGLLPAGFQEDIEKCDAVYGSTHKSFPGPQGGIIFTNDESVDEKIEENLTWRTQDNYHTNRVAALAMALYEFSPVAKIYGKNVAENSRALARALEEGGLGIKHSPEYTNSHQVLVDENSLKDEFSLTPPQMSEVLEENGIIVDSVGRIGTAELTWKGYGPEDMREIAGIIIAALEGEDVKEEVLRMVDKWDGKTMGSRI